MRAFLQTAMMDCDLHASIDVIEAHLGHRLNCETSLVEYVRSLLQRSEALRQENRSLGCCLAEAKEKATSISHLLAASATRTALLRAELSQSNADRDAAVAEKAEALSTVAILENQLAERAAAFAAMEEDQSRLARSILESQECAERLAICSSADSDILDFNATYFRNTIRAHAEPSAPVIVDTLSITTAEAAKDEGAEAAAAEGEGIGAEVALRAEHDSERVRWRAAESEYKTRITRLEIELRDLRRRRDVAEEKRNLRTQIVPESSTEPPTLQSSHSEVAVLNPRPAPVPRPATRAVVQPMVGRSVSRQRATAVPTRAVPAHAVAQPRIPPPPLRAASPTGRANGFASPSPPPATRTAQLTNMLHQLRKEGAGLHEGKGSGGRQSQDSMRSQQARMRNREEGLSPAKHLAAAVSDVPPSKLFPKTLSRSPARKATIPPQPTRNAPPSGFRSAAPMGT